MSAAIENNMHSNYMSKYYAKLILFNRLTPFLSVITPNITLFKIHTININ
jgi:hypothetical protein